jgi:hypothetical protein
MVSQEKFNINKILEVSVPIQVQQLINIVIGTMVMNLANICTRTCSVSRICPMNSWWLGTSGEAYEL